MEFRDLKSQYKTLKDKIDEAVIKVMTDCNFISGSQVKELERKLAEYVGVKHCITCANGTDAIQMLLMAWDVKEGDAVFVPDFTFFATVEPAVQLGATPVFVDVDEDTFNIDSKSLEKSIEEVVKEGILNPKVVIPVDLFGLPADYDEIERIAKKYDLKVLEDGAQGFGAMYKGKRACSFGDGATTSFFPAKPLGCYGDGGAIFTNSDEDAEFIRSIAVHGKGSNKYDNVRIGLNSRLDTIQAAVLLVKFEAFKEYELDKVNEVANIYTEQLKDKVKTPIVPKDYYSSWAQYTIQLKDKEERNQLQQRLKEQNIPTMIYYIKPLHTQTALKNFKMHVDCPVAEKLCDKVLSLPIDASKADSEYINITSFFSC